MNSSKDIVRETKRNMNDERGFVLVSALMMLLVLLVIGIAATNTTTMELQISGNDKEAKQNFYAAESAAYEGYGVLKTIKDELQAGTHHPFVQQTASEQTIDIATFRNDQKSELNSGIRKVSTWIKEGETSENSKDGVLANTSFRSMDLGAKGGSTLTLNSTTGGIVHTYVVVGRYSETAGGHREEAMVELGLRIR